MAIDRERLRSEVYGEGARVAHVPSPGPTPRGARELPFDPVRAREILGAEGAVGLKLPLYSSKSEVDRLIAARLVADLHAAGFDVQLQVVDNLAALHRKRQHGGLLHWAIRATDDTDPRAYWNIPLRDGRYVDEARNDAYTDEVAALVARHKRALYPERRRQLMEGLFAAYSAGLPQLPLLFASERLVVDPALRGWDHGVEADFGEGIEAWHFADGKGAGR